MTDAETRTELERIDPTCSAWWDLLAENSDLSSEEGKMLRLLALKHKALRAVERESSNVDSNGSPSYYCGLIETLNELAKTACKED